MKARSGSTALVVLLLATAVRAQDSAPAPTEEPAPASAEEPAPVPAEVDAVFPAPPMVSPPTAEPDPTPEPAPPATPATPGPSTETAPAAEDSSCMGPAMGAVAGCAACGLPLDGISVAGIGFFIALLDAAIQEGGCGALLAVIVIGGPALIAGVASAALAGPLVPAATMAGGAIGAAMAGRPFWPALVGGLPGLLVGTVGSGLLIASITVLNDNPEFRGDNPIGSDLMMGTLIGGAIASFVAGPLALAGVLGADALWGDPEVAETPPVKSAQQTLAPKPAPTPAPPAAQPSPDSEAAGEGSSTPAPVTAPDRPVYDY